jgi:hypothetical protein
MGSLQNLNRSGSSLVQLSRAAVVANQSSLAPGSGNPSLMGFNSAVGGGRITPTSSGSAASVSGNCNVLFDNQKKVTSYTNFWSVIVLPLCLKYLHSEHIQSLTHRWPCLGDG